MQKRNLKQGTYYHVYNRGNTKGRLFLELQDWERFANTISRYLKDYTSIRIHVWCFLPNHFHFLLSEDSKPGLEKGEQKIKPGLESKEISMFMHRIQLAYAMYYSLKYKDTIKQGKKAPVFEGNFKAKEITDENYLAQVAYYIRHNAVKHGIVDDVRNWAWAGSMSTEEFPVQEYTGIDAEFDPGFE